MKFQHEVRQIYKDAYYAVKVGFGIEEPYFITTKLGTKGTGGRLSDYCASIEMAWESAYHRLPVSESPLPQPEYKKLHERIELEEMRGYCEQMEEKIKTLQVDRDFWAQTAASINPESPLPGREAQEESRTIVGLADDLAEALYTVIAAIPKQTEDADWWQDDLSTAVREARKLLAEYTAFPDAPQLPVRPEDSNVIE